MPSLREYENASSDRIICPQFIFLRGFNSGTTSHLNQIRKLTSTLEIPYNEIPCNETSL